MRLLPCLVLLVVARNAPLFAQCADGSPPPCSRPVALASRPTLDPARIAILPFRVTTADTLFGEGLAELIATEFTSESGPRAVHMGNVLRAWRRAGGGLRTPLSQSEGIRVARDVGAGLLIEGSVIGLGGSRLRIAASVVRVQDGTARRIQPVAGTADSIEAILGRLTSSLLAAAGSARSAKPITSLTESPEAMRAYLEGLSHWRRARYAEAMNALERAWVADTTFAQAAFMRYRIGQWQLENAGTSPWTRRARDGRERLSREDRLLHLGYFGEPGVARTRAQALTELRNAATLLPESPDAQYRLGDNLWHFGLAMSASDWLGSARTQFERALELDSLAPILQHVLEIGMVTSDTALVRRVLPPFTGMYDSRGQVSGFVTVPKWGWVWLAAGRLGDVNLLAALRRQVSDSAPAGVNSRAGVYGLSAALTDEMHALSQRHGTPNDKWVANRSYFIAATVQGRPSAAARASQAWPDTVRRDVLIVLASMFADGDSVTAAAAAARLTTYVPADSVLLGEVRCALAHWTLHRGHADDADGGLRLLDQERCADALALDRAARTRDPSFPARLAAADSSIRGSASIVNYGQFEHIVLARHLEASGALRAALDAIRARSTFQSLEWTAATCARIEGRLAAAVGDTVAAVRAYRHYLLMRRDAEPSLVPQRDSVRAELARLQRR